MTTYHGYIQVPHSTYDEWKNATIGNQYDVDGYPLNQPYQCWDYAALIYFQYGRRLITKPGGYGTAADCWNISRAANSVAPFTSLTGVENIKRGDIIVINSNEYSSTGHITFADEDYNGTNTIRCLGQNQGRNDQNQIVVKLTDLSLTNFLGVFRNSNWQTPPTPPTPTETPKKRKFPWGVAWNNWDNFEH